MIKIIVVLFAAVALGRLFRRIRTRRMTKAVPKALPPDEVL